MAEREPEFREGRSLEIRGDMTEPREVRIVEELSQLKRQAASISSQIPLDTRATCLYLNITGVMTHSPRAKDSSSFKLCRAPTLNSKTC